jgi:hypothetical protein
MAFAPSSEHLLLTGSADNVSSSLHSFTSSSPKSLFFITHARPLRCGISVASVPNSTLSNLTLPPFSKSHGPHILLSTLHQHPKIAESTFGIYRLSEQNKLRMTLKTVLQN